MGECYHSGLAREVWDWDFWALKPLSVEMEAITNLSRLVVRHAASLCD